MGKDDFRIRSSVQRNGNQHPPHLLDARFWCSRSPITTALIQSFRPKSLSERVGPAPAADHEVIGWSSPHDMSMMEWAGKVMEDLLAPVIEVATQATEFSERAPSLTGSKPRWQVVETWANVQRHGGINAVHPHPGTFWSGVYYVDVGNTQDSCCGGELQLFDPRGLPTDDAGAVSPLAVPELHDAGKSISFTPDAGKCVLFQGWLSILSGCIQDAAAHLAVEFILIRLSTSSRTGFTKRSLLDPDTMPRFTHEHSPTLWALDMPFCAILLILLRVFAPDHGL